MRACSSVSAAAAPIVTGHGGHRDGAHHEGIQQKADDEAALNDVADAGEQQTEHRGRESSHHSSRPADTPTHRSPSPAPICLVWLTPSWKGSQRVSGPDPKCRASAGNELAERAEGTDPVGRFFRPLGAMAVLPVRAGARAPGSVYSKFRRIR
jgi:hypothetical protein